ncbi:hypothetical protein [Clostridium lundense]|uniref:hypothetical protein n=1 Tax=Clostridium lundense TaxID=319475 RepID=UPI0012EB6B69|nr:hypothetical protein [Clostridium lundense]
MFKLKDKNSKGSTTNINLTTLTFHVPSILNCLIKYSIDSNTPSSIAANPSIIEYKILISKVVLK